jgi:small GTP-binding protein
MQKAFHKVVLVGSAGSGKSALLCKKLWPKKPFDHFYQNTVGIDYVQLAVRSLGDNKLRHIELWDTAGQERYAVLIKTYVRNAQVACVAYDMTDRSTFKEVDRYVQMLREHDIPPTHIIIIATKLDLLDLREIAKTEGAAKAAEFGCRFTETSAAEGWHIEELFASIADLLPANTNATTVIDGVQPDLIPFDALTSRKKSPTCCWLM